MFNSLTSLYAPHRCLGCQTEGSLLCLECSNSLPAAPARCYRCRALSPGGRTCQTCRTRSKLYAVHAATIYKSVGKDLISRLKFSGTRSAATVIAARMLQLPLPEDAVIVPIPTATGRRRLRGYDQATLIAKQLARQTKVEYLPCLLRIGQHRQVGASRAERLLQMRQSFVVRHVEDVKNRHIVLVDDVMTTGATLESAAAELKAAGAKRVEAVVFARA